MRILLAIVVLAVIGWSVADHNPCADAPNGPGCVDGHEIRDDIDQQRADQREADMKAMREAVDALCATARDEGDTSACVQ
jgi:hypothetical protein